MNAKRHPLVNAYYFNPIKSNKTTSVPAWPPHLMWREEQLLIAL